MSILIIFSNNGIMTSINKNKPTIIKAVLYCDDNIIQYM